MKKLAAMLVMVTVLAGVPLWAQEMATQITFGERRDKDPVVSPDGNHLAFSSERTGAFNIFLITFGKEGYMQLTQGKKDDRYPSWSPDGKKIAFSSKRTGNSDIYEMAYDGSSGFLQLTDKEELEEYPSYDPRAGGLLFASAPKKVVQVRPKMSVVYADQKGQANNCRPLADGDEPRFAPDGKKIVFVSRRTKNNDIWLMNADGGQQMQLTTEPKDDENPAFSPDGRKIVFASNRTGNFDIWVMDSDGGNQRQLTTDPVDETQPCWSTGGYIYFVKKASDTKSNIYRIKAP